MSRMTELMSGLLAATAGVTGILMATFSETRLSETTGPGRPWTDDTVWFGHGVDLQLIIYLVSVLAAIALVAVAAYRHSRRAGRASLVALWGATLLSLALAVLDLPAWSSSLSLSGITQWNGTGIGVFILPAVFLALVASIAATPLPGQKHNPLSLYPR